MAEGKPGSPLAFGPVGSYFDRMGYLAKRGDVHVEDNWESWGGAIQSWWLGSAVWIAEDRSRYGPLVWQNWEKLVQAMADLDRPEGARQVDLEFALGPSLSLGIRELIERLRLEQEMKLGVVPTWSPAQPAEETQA